MIRLLDSAPQAAPAIVVGADDGAVLVYSMAGMYAIDAEGGAASEQEQRLRLDAALQRHTAQAVSE